MQVKQKVETILEQYPETRDSDQKLIIYLWWYFNKEKMKHDGKNWWVKLDDVLDLEKPDSLTRCRRKVQELGHYQASKPVQEQREVYRDEMQHNMPQPGWEYNEYLN